MEGKTKTAKGSAVDEFIEEYVKTWEFVKDEWVYRGLCKKRTEGKSDGTYLYFKFYKVQMRQEA